MLFAFKNGVADIISLVNAIENYYHLSFQSISQPSPRSTGGASPPTSIRREDLNNIRSRKHSAATQPLLTQSLIAMAAIGLPAAVQAQAQEKTMAEVQVQAGAEAPYKAEKASSPKLTQPLVDTPQTVSVIRKEVMLEQGASTIMEALRNTPGITLQLGENGNTSAGDTFQLRGFSAQSALFVDGIRDLGAITRDTFNIEQIQIAKGRAGAHIGRGAGGRHNKLVTKPANPREAAW